MAGPFDYSLQVANPFASALKGYKAGSAIRQDQFNQQAQQVELQQQQAKLQAQQQRQALLSSLASNPNATADDYTRVMTQMPDLAENLSKVWSLKNDAQQQSHSSNLLQIGAALKSGTVDVAEKLLLDRATVVEASGDKREADALRANAGVVKQNPALALGMIQAQLAASPRGKDAAEALAKFGSEERAAELQPLEVRQKTAQASGAESDAAVKRVEAQYAPKRIPMEIEKLGQEIGLTTAQIGQAKASAAASYASANASNANAAKTRREMEQSGTGLLPPDKAMEAEAKLRREYSDQTKGFQEVREAYRRVKSSNNDAVGDLSLIFGYMKMLDPGSVVREGEFATAQNAAGVPERVQNIYNRAISGERLTPGQRKAFIGQAEKLFGSAQQQEKTVRTGLERIASGYGIKRENIFYDPSNTPEDAPRSSLPSPTPRSGGPAVGTVEGGYRFKGGDPSQQSSWERVR